MLRWAVRALLADKRITQVRVIAAAGDERAGESVKGLPRVVVRFCGGPTRAATVMAALEDTDLDQNTWVLVHDAARPGLPPTPWRGSSVHSWRVAQAGCREPKSHRSNSTHLNA